MQEQGSMPQIGMIPQPTREERARLERTASGIMVPEGTVEKIVKASQAKAQRKAAPRPTRKEVRALGNTRVTCKRCKTPIKLKNFASHAQRLHPESETAKKADTQTHVHP